MAISVVNPSTGGTATSPGAGAVAANPNTAASASRTGNGGVAIPTGTPGPPGKSAYELAVDEGFVGTEEEWLAEIEGDVGPQGPTGPQGPPGPIGEPDLPSMTLIFENALI